MILTCGVVNPIKINMAQITRCHQFGGISYLLHQEQCGSMYSYAFICDIHQGHHKIHYQRHLNKEENNQCHTSVRQEVFRWRWRRHHNHKE